MPKSKLLTDLRVCQELLHNNYRELIFSSPEDLHCLTTQILRISVPVFVTNLVNGVKQPDGGVKCLTPRQAGGLLGHSTSQITEMYYVKRDNSRLVGITDSFEF